MARRDFLDKARPPGTVRTLLRRTVEPSRGYLSVRAGRAKRPSGSSPQSLAGFNTRVRKPRPRSPHPWRGFAFDAPGTAFSTVALGSRTRRGSPTDTPTGFTNPARNAAAAIPVAGWRGSAFCISSVTVEPASTRPEEAVRPDAARLALCPQPIA
jgi:hypothetical protein